MVRGLNVLAEGAPLVGGIMKAVTVPRNTRIARRRTATSRRARQRWRRSRKGGGARTRRAECNKKELEDYWRFGQMPVSKLQAVERQLKRLRAIQPFIRTTAQASVGLRGREFVSCLRASLAKSFEFCLEAYKYRTNHIAFFLVPSLRSICEDLIVLS
jgi:hypothetical protein